MTEISEAAKAKWNELLDSSIRNGDAGPRFIQQVSDVARRVSEEAPKAISPSGYLKLSLAPFILPEPVDPLLAVIEALRGDGHMNPTPHETADRLRAELAKRGLKIVEAA